MAAWRGFDLEWWLKISSLSLLYHEHRGSASLLPYTRLYSGVSHAALTNLHYVQPVYLPIAALTSFLAFSLISTTINGIQNFLPPTFKLDKPLSVTEEILITLICDALLIFLGDNRFVGLCNYLPFWFPLSKLRGKGYIMFEENMYVLCYCN